MNIRKENSLKLMVYLLLIVVLEILSYSEAKVIQKQYGMPIFAPVINIILVPYLTFIMGREIGGISGIRNEILKSKNKCGLLLKCFQILFLIVAIYIVLISSGRIINSITGRMIIPSEYLNNCGELYVRLYDYTKSELNTILILIFILAGYMVSIKGFNNFD